MNGDSRWLCIPRKGIRGHEYALLQLTQSRRNWTITTVLGKMWDLGLAVSVNRWSMFYDPNDLRSNVPRSVLFWLKDCAITVISDRAFLQRDNADLYLHFYICKVTQSILITVLALYASENNLVPSQKRKKVFLRSHFYKSGN